MSLSKNNYSRYNEKRAIFKKIINSNNSPNKVLQSSFKKNDQNSSPKKVKIILPNVSNNNISINKNINNKINIGTNINKNKLDKTNNFVNPLLNNSIDKNINQNKKISTNLNRSTSLPSLNHKNIFKIGKEANNSKNNFLYITNKNMNKSTFLYNNNLKNIPKMKNNDISKILDLNMNKTTDFSGNNNMSKDLKNSTIKISKIKLNESIPYKKENGQEKLKLNNNLNKKNLKNNSFYRHESTIIDIPKHSHFFKIAQKDNISAKRIYKHYLNKSAGEIVKPIKNYKKFFDNRSKSYLEKLSRIYCENRNYLGIIKELKDNNLIAFKDDFNIEEYQSTLIELMDQRVSPKYLLDLQNDYRTLDRKFFGLIEPKGRFTILADKLRYNLPLYLLERFKQLDKESVLSRMRYYNKFKKFQNENKLVSRFGRNYGKISLINDSQTNNSMNNELFDKKNI